MPFNLSCQKSAKSASTPTLPTRLPPTPTRIQTTQFPLHKQSKRLSAPSLTHFSNTTIHPLPLSCPIHPSQLTSQTTSNIYYFISVSFLIPKISHSTTTSPPRRNSSSLHHGLVQCYLLPFLSTISPPFTSVLPTPLPIPIPPPPPTLTIPRT